jgi:mRNA interferase MazF
MELKQLDIVLCEFYFSDLNKTKKRPVLVFKDNLPYDDFVAIPISSKIDNLKQDEILIDNSDFEDGSIKKISKLMIRKTFVVSKKVVIKRYGTLNKKSYEIYLAAFCKYFGCEKIGCK